MRRIIQHFIIIILVYVIAGVAFAAGRGTVVYITKTGEKYHTEGCSSVRNSKIAITLGDAVSRRFEPCQLCRPPVLDGDE
jgi:hypothetical protein